MSDLGPIATNVLVVTAAAVNYLRTRRNAAKTEEVKQKVDPLSNGFAAGVKDSLARIEAKADRIEGKTEVNTEAIRDLTLVVGANTNRITELEKK